MLLMYLFIFFFFKQKTAYEMRISDWSSDVCSSDLAAPLVVVGEVGLDGLRHPRREAVLVARAVLPALGAGPVVGHQHHDRVVELPGLLQRFEEPPDPRVGVSAEARVHLLVAHAHTQRVGIAVVPAPLHPAPRGQPPPPRIREAR